MKLPQKGEWYEQSKTVFLEVIEVREIKGITYYAYKRHLIDDGEYIIDVETELSSYRQVVDEDEIAKLMLLTNSSVEIHV